jgi:hypothetical protein
LPVGMNKRRRGEGGVKNERQKIKDRIWSTTK